MALVLLSMIPRVGCWQRKVPFSMSLQFQELNLEQHGRASPVLDRNCNTDRILIEDDSAIVIAWIQDRSEQHLVHPFLRDIWYSLELPVSSTVHHIFRNANSAADWVAFFVLKHSIDWSLHHKNCIPPSF